MEKGLDKETDRTVTDKEAMGSVRGPRDRLLRGPENKLNGGGGYN